MYRHSRFLRPQGAAKMLVGEPPKTRHFGTLCPEVSGASALYLRHRCLSLLFLIFLPVRQAQQMVNVYLDRHGLPHFPLRFPVLGVQFLFPCCQSAALSFSASIFGSFAPPSSSFMAAFAAR